MSEGKTLFAQSRHDAGTETACTSGVPRRMRAPVVARSSVAWLGLIGSSLLACVYGWWGILANFHFGWYQSSLGLKLLSMLAYLSPSLISVILSVCALRFPNCGFGLYTLVASCLLLWLFYKYSTEGRRPADHLVITVAALVGVGLCYWWGKPRASRTAYFLLIVLPLAAILGFGLGPAVRIAHRFDDGIRTARIVQGNKVMLEWAPAGRGWPRSANTWNDARWICAHLSEDGASLAATPQNKWRLPTVNELVRSLTRDGEAAGGTVGAKDVSVTFDRAPDKEAPLWDPTSPIIYFWTATEVDRDHAYAVCFNGQVVSARKDTIFEPRGFRAVRSVSIDSLNVNRK